MATKGIDVSQHQGDINWSKVRSDGQRFGICKVSEGQDYRDPSFSAARVKSMRKANVRVGVYHYLRPRSGRTGDVEARWAVKTAEQAGWGKPGDIVLACDVEETDLNEQATARYVKQFCDRVEKLTGARPLIYSFPGFRENLQGASLGRFPLWIAHWGVSNPDVFAPWNDYHIHQFSEKGQVKGIIGNVDLNRAEKLPLLEGKPKANTIPKKLRRRYRKVVGEIRDRREKLGRRLLEIFDKATNRPPKDPPKPDPKPPRNKPKGAPKNLPKRYWGMWREPWTAKARQSRGFKNWCWRNGLLSPHISRKELASKGGDSCGCPGLPVPRRLKGRAQQLAFKLEIVRHKDGDRPLGILSGWRSDCHNGCVGGASLSKHKEGTAIDPTPMAQPGSDRHAAFQQVFGDGGIGYDNYIGGPIRHVDLGPKRVWVY